MIRVCVDCLPEWLLTPLAVGGIPPLSCSDALHHFSYAAFAAIM
jgi:hypothetical protein